MHLYLAPIRGVTDCIFRTVYASHFSGFDTGIAPFVSLVKGRAVKRSHLKDILPENNPVLPIIPQIMGNNADEFISLSSAMFDLGYSTVNWNLGCPSPQVTKKKRGSGLLPFPEKIESLLDCVVPRIPNALSIKTRLGLDSKDEIWESLAIFNRFPLAEIILHPRTGRQLYDGEADLEEFEKFLKASVHPVVYNGDIVSKESFDTLRRRFPHNDKWMIGRGAIANPVLAESLRDESPAAGIYPRIKRFHDDLVEAYGAVFENGGGIVDKMKGLWFFLNRSFPHGATHLKRIQKIRRLDHYQALIEEIFDSP